VTLTSTLELTTEKIWLDGFVNSIINNAKSITQHKELNWHVHLDSHITLQADPGKLARVVHEVLKNALQFTPPHGTISVNLTRYEKQVGIIIQDSGIGIPADEIDRIFDRFYRVDKARTMRRAGLGLAVAKLLVEAHHGEIKVESVLEQGSRFEILLPLK
jgi:two-component system phosphate regulon sensor histidine kinase PhoR